MSWDAFWQFLRDFTLSPGLGGLAALIAAIVFYRSTGRTAATPQTVGEPREATAAEEPTTPAVPVLNAADAEDLRQLQEVTARQREWWNRARWAMELSLQKDERSRILGFDTLEALANSEWADPRDRAIIAAVSRGLNQTHRPGRRHLRGRERRFTTQAEVTAAAQARVAADKLRGVQTDAKIIALANLYRHSA